MTDRTFPLITAHTGCMGTPDNSIDSIAAAVKHGADIAEDDVRATRDGKLVLGHDDIVRSADGGEIRISASAFGELAERAASPLVPLEEALLLAKGAGILFNLDIKDDAALEPVYALAAKHEMTDRVFLSGCEFARAKLAQLQVPPLRKLLNVRIASFAAKGQEEAVRQACEEALDSGCFGLNVPYQLVSGPLLDRAAEARLSVYVWTVNEPSHMRWLAKLGIASITTRDVASLRAVKEEWEREARLA